MTIVQMRRALRIAKKALKFYQVPQRIYMPGDAIDPAHKVISFFDHGEVARRASSKIKRLEDK